MSGDAPYDLESHPHFPEAVEDIEGVLVLLDQWWAEALPTVFGVDYIQPEYLLYDGASPELPVCGDVTLPGDNAWYCSLDHTVSIDMRFLLDTMSIDGSERGVAAPGDTFIYILHAHEWGHAIQTLLTSGVATTNPDRELQADCFAGAIIGSSIANGWLEVDYEDFNEIVASLHYIRDIGDPSADPTKAHGTSFERNSSFNLGMYEGAASCAPDAALTTDAGEDQSPGDQTAGGKLPEGGVCPTGTPLERWVDGGGLVIPGYQLEGEDPIPETRVVLDEQLGDPGGYADLQDARAVAWPWVLENEWGHGKWVGVVLQDTSGRFFPFTTHIWEPVISNDGDYVNPHYPCEISSSDAAISAWYRFRLWGEEQHRLWVWQAAGGGVQTGFDTTDVRQLLSTSG